MIDEYDNSDFADYSENDYNDISDEYFDSDIEYDNNETDNNEITNDENTILSTDNETETDIEQHSNEENIQHEDNNDDNIDNLIINENMIEFFKNLYNHVNNRNDEFSQLFTNTILEDINNRKHFTDKHSKYNIDKYNLLIRENKYNNHNDACGWVFDDDNQPVNIHVTNELKQTKTDDEIFDIVLVELIRRNKISFTTKSVPTQIYKLLNIDVDKYIK